MLRSAFMRGCGLAAGLAGVLFAMWGYVHKENAPAYFGTIANTLAIVVPLLFLLGLGGLYARCKGEVGWLGVAGFMLGSIGAAEGIVNGATDFPLWHAYLTGTVWFSALLDWLSLLLAGLALAGIAAVGREILRRWGTLLLAMGTFGWAYCLTDAGNAVETRPGHVAFGI